MSAFAPSQNVRFANFEVDFQRREIRKQGKRIPIQPKPFRILQLLLESQGSVVSREEIARHLWPDLRVSFERSLNTAVNILRQALGDSSQEAKFIETRSGYGYIFVARVESVTRRVEHHDYLRGCYFLEKMTEGDTRKAIAHFESALSSGGEPALTYAALAEAQCELARLSTASFDAAAQEAASCARIAMDLGVELAEVHLSMARVKMLFEQDWDGSHNQFLHALEIDSECAAVHRCYASYLCFQNENDGALKHIQRAQSIEPLSLPVGVDLGVILYNRGDYNEAAEQCWKILSLEPSLWWAQLVLGLCYKELGANEEAISELENAVICSGHHPLTVAALNGYVIDARRIILGSPNAPFNRIRENRAGQGSA